MSISLRGAARRRAVMGLVVVAALGGLFLASRTRASSAAGARLGAAPQGGALAVSSPHGAGHLPSRVPLASCDSGKDTSSSHGPKGDPEARKGAQRGLTFVAANATEWQMSHNCYGCHVQAVALEALTVGRRNQYEVPQKDVDTMLRGMLELRGGAHGSAGLSYENASLFEPAKAFGGAALAHYDQAGGTGVREELLAVAKELVKLQAEDGHVGDYSNGPVAVGSLQTTTQALQTWRQAYDRTADETWLSPMRRAEGFLQARAKELVSAEVIDTQKGDYAIIGLVAAGASRSEDTLQTLAKKLVLAQNEDGGFSAARSAPSSALITGATLYALRLTGATDDDGAIAKGTRYLLKQQAEDGSWSHGGSSRGEAMWAVLGLVTMDVMSVDLVGVKEGARVDGLIKVDATAKDNGGGSVVRMDLAVDDVALKSNCGSTLAFALDSTWLGDGAHTIDVIATNARGQESRRRVQVYAGAYYLTELGTRFEDNGTTFAFRNLAPEGLADKVELHVYNTRLQNQERVRGDEIATRIDAAVQGPMRLFWNGKDATGKAQNSGQYVAELRFVDPKGVVVQHIETPFVNDTVDAQQARYGIVDGDLQSDQRGPLANQQVELVDKLGNVVQRVTSTAAGNYRFQNVEGGDYKVRVRRDGFAAQEATVTAAPAAKAAAPMMLKAQ